MAEVQCITVPPVEYRDIPGFPGYRVGDDGSVWSCWVRQASGRAKGVQRVMNRDRWHRLVPLKDKRGRLSVKPCSGGKVYRRFVHRLVLEAFVGPCPDGMECCHFPDRDPANCQLTNLRWDTRKANAFDRKKHGTQLFGERQPRAKLTEDQVREILLRAACGESHEKLAGDFIVSPGNIWYIVTGKSWKHLKTDWDEVVRMLAPPAPVV